VLVSEKNNDIARSRSTSIARCREIARSTPASVERESRTRVRTLARRARARSFASPLVDERDEASKSPMSSDASAMAGADDVTPMDDHWAHFFNRECGLVDVALGRRVENAAERRRTR